MSDQPSEISLESILAFLSEKYPNGATFLNGDLTPRPQAAKVTNLQALGELARAPQNLTFELRGQMMSMDVRGLNGEEAAEVDKIPDPVAPMKKMPTGKGGATVDQYDFNDPAYKAQVQQAFELKRAMMISMGLVGLEVPGSNVDEKAAWLRKTFPPQVLELIRSKIQSLTSDEISTAAFV